MQEKIKSKISTTRIRELFTLYQISVMVIIVISFSILWAGIRVVQRNYILLKQVSVLEQEIELMKISVANQKLMNEYYSTDSYGEIAARRLLNKSMPGEKLMLVPKSLALEKVTGALASGSVDTGEYKPKLNNWQKWIRFLSGKSLED